MISLPDKPNGEQYEDAVSSFIRSRGYFAETRLILDSDGRELLELDVVVSPSTEDINSTTLVDAKSGNTGFKDVFKIYGWRKFLGIDKGCVARLKIPSSDVEVFKKYEDKLSVYVRKFAIDEYDEFSDFFPVLHNNDDELCDEIFITGWYAGIAERLCVKSFNLIKKQHKQEDVIKSVKAYEKACKLSFFEKNPLTRVNNLYSAFHENPNISRQCMEFAAELEETTIAKIQKAVWDTSKYPWIQYVMMIEHRARVLIIKNAVELMETYSDHELSGKLKVYMTPSNFRRSFVKLRKSKYCYKIPYLLHLLIEVLGGFYIHHEEYDDDIKMLSKLTGINQSKIITCLNTINNFFPTTNSWFMTSKDEFHHIKYYPAIWKGVGCFLRDNRSNGEYDDISPNMGWLLTKYHNRSYKFLYPELKSKK